MKVKALLAAVMLTGACITASAQSEVNNWFIQPQVGATYTSGSGSFGKLVAPAGQLSAGKYFNETVGARLAISGWRGNGVGQRHRCPQFRRCCRICDRL